VSASVDVGSAPPSIATDAPPDTGGWSLVQSGDAATDEQFTTVIATDLRYVVGGSAGPAADQPIAVSSRDGALWAAEPVPARPGPSISAMTRWGDRIIATGRADSNRCAHPGGEMDVWVRTSAGDWTEAPFDPAFCAGGGVRPVIFRDRAWLIGSGVADVPFDLVSDDGLHWTNDARPLGDVFVVGAVAAEGALWVTARKPDGSPMLLRSTDGVQFDVRPVEVASGRPVDVVAAVSPSDRLTLLVTDGTAMGVLRSDGRGGWQEAATEGLPLRGLLGVETVGDRLVALASPEVKPQAAWSSVDGVRWMPITLPDETAVDGVVIGMATAHNWVVAVGQADAPDTGALAGAIWMAPAEVLGP
jgi:hypothetical protein